MSRSRTTPRPEGASLAFASLFAGLLASAATLSCGQGEEPLGPQGVDFELGIPDRLSDLNLLEWDGERIVYKENVEPYDLNTPLFSDYAVKDRAIFVPEGTTYSYVDNGVFEFPVGTVIVKSFMFPADLREPDQNIDLIETRVLVRFEDDWKAYPYVWDHELGDAVLTVQGEVREISFIDRDGLERTSNYLVPQKNQCKECHEYKDEADETLLTPIGPWARHLNREGPDGKNQLQRMADDGVLTGLVPLDQVPAAWDMRELETTSVDELSGDDLTRAARSYLDINCAYCHNPSGVNGISSQLFLNHDNEDAFNLGVCKKPGSAGEGGLRYRAG